MSSLCVISTPAYFLIGPYLRFQISYKVKFLYLRLVRMRICSLDYPSVFILLKVRGGVVFYRASYRTFLSGCCEAPAVCRVLSKLLYQTCGPFRLSASAPLFNQNFGLASFTSCSLGLLLPCVYIVAYNFLFVNSFFKKSCINFTSSRGFLCFLCADCTSFGIKTGCGARLKNNVIV